jgi:hypothetical protein
LLNDRLRVIGDMTSRFFRASGPNVVGEYNSDIDSPPIFETPVCEARDMGGQADMRKRSGRHSRKLPFEKRG